MRTAAQPRSVRSALNVAADLLDRVGADQITLVTFTATRICLQPANLSDGERLARALGCDRPQDHRMITPGYTLWSGVISGFEVAVRGRLRRPAEVLR